MLFNYTSGLKEVFDRSGNYLPGQIVKSGWKLAPALNTLSTNPAIEFGTVVKRAVDANGLPYATTLTTTDTAANIFGVAVRDVVSQSQVNYGNSTTSYIYQYLAGQPISVMVEGFIAVPVQNGTPSVGGQVYVRIAASITNPNLPIGGIETALVEDETVAWTGATFESGSYFPMNGTSSEPTSTVATSQCATIFIK